ncbi:cupin domain-containing protein [Rhodoligotrophos defluvii]|uniref:cupin domain-containing protein n=1 Tax=Rhodoligotrophos defluvii TaxID=2561934 RepID=UPI001EF03739|nr:cupin domain-containing protein [Rhodoligotrophos defluvii]
MHQEEADRTKPSGAASPTIARPGEYFFEMAGLDEVQGGPDYSSAVGTAVVGERMMTALMRMPAGTGSDPHSHPNEQWIFVLQGTLEMFVGETSRLATPGMAIYIPADIVHHARVSGDDDVVFFTVKDTSHGLHGTRQG